MVEFAILRIILQLKLDMACHFMGVIGYFSENKNGNALAGYLDSTSSICFVRSIWVNY